MLRNQTAIFICIILTCVLFRITDSNIHLETNIWREQRHSVKEPGDPGTLYGNERHCKGPEPAELREAASHKDETWSVFFSRYVLDAGDELDVWLVNQETHPDTKNEKHIGDVTSDVLIQVMFPILFLIVLFQCTIFIPLAGAFGFRVLLIIWYIITHQEIKRVGRRGLIIYEKILRYRERILLPENFKRIPKSRFRLPVFFRLYSDEEVPSELEQSDDEDDWLVDNAVEEEKQLEMDEATLSGLEIDDDDDWVENENEGDENRDEQLDQK